MGSKIKVTLSRLHGECPCWDWTAHVDGNGPGWVYAGKRIKLTHKGPNDVVVAFGRKRWKVYSEHHRTVPYKKWKERTNPWREKT